MYRVNATKLPEIKDEIMATDDETIFFDSSSIVPFALVWMADKGKYPIVRHTPTVSEYAGTNINSYINIMSYDYGGKLDLLIDLCSTDVKEVKRLTGVKRELSISNLAEILNKCPKAKNKITLVFNSKAKKLNYSMIENNFPTNRFNVLVEGEKSEKMIDKFKSMGYNIYSSHGVQFNGKNGWL